MRRCALLFVAAAAAACARPYAPPGGERDVIPPLLVSVTPEPLAVVAPGAGPVVIRFSERISQRRFNRTLVTVTPAAPQEVQARVSGNELRISLEGGWQPDRVYQVVVRPGIMDLFGNERRESVELIFSTGAPPPPTALAGTLEERITARAPANGAVEALRVSDSAVYVATADTAGFYALRHVPYGTYEVTAYADQNRNRRRDASEAMAGPLTTTLESGRDTVMLLMQLLPRDTTAPRLVEADRLDSLHIRLTFDDYLETETGFAGMSVRLLMLPDSAPLVRNPRLMLATTWQRERSARQAEGDTTATPEVRPEPPPPDSPPRPDRALVVALDRPLPPASVVVVVTGARNVNGLEGGGSATAAYRPPAAAPPTPVPGEPGEPPPGP